MLTYPEIDPVIFTLGPIQPRWYGVMYLIGFAAGYLLLAYRAKKPGSLWTPEQVSDVIFYGALGVILGGRAGYVFFYNFPVFLSDPLTLFRIWDGGMSFHGGFLGVMLAMWWYGRKQGRKLFDILDYGAPIVPIGLGAGRLGNFIGQELWGKVTDVPWGMVFPKAGELPRHPSQLYQAALEGVVLFAILWWFSSRPRPRYAVSGMFALWYGVFRFSVEFVREPDAHIGYLAFGWLTMGQVLSLPMVAVGIFLLTLAYRQRQYPEGAVRS